MIPFGHLELAQIVDLPDGEGPFPLVILLHGFTGWKEEEHLATLARALNGVGIAALRYDAPGSGDSTGRFADDYRLTNYVASVDAAIEWAQDELAPSSMGIWGHSMGGYVALANANKFAAVCGSQPSHGKGAIPPDQREQWQASGWTTFSNRRFPHIELPYAFYEDRQRHDLMPLVPELKVPLLLIAGTRDALVPPESVRQVFDAAPHPKAYEEFNVNHFYKAAPGPLGRINAVTVDFFTTYL